jgi:hypothetical protein
MQQNADTQQRKASMCTGMILKLLQLGAIKAENVIEMTSYKK